MVEIVKTETIKLKNLCKNIFWGRQHGLFKVGYLELLQDR